MMLRLQINSLAFGFVLALCFSGCGDDGETAQGDALSESVDDAESAPLDVSDDAADVSEPTSDVSESATDVSAGPSDEAGDSSDAFEDVLDEVELPLDVTEGAPAEPESAGAEGFMDLSEAGDVVSFVEVERYMGLWYEIATTPSFQQGSCYSTQAQYSFNEAQGWVDVVNSCRIGSTSGNLQQIAGRAELVDLETQAKLNVIFYGQVAPYWVVALDGAEGEEPYQWAVVSVPGGQVMWLLSRTKQMTDVLRQSIESHLIERGFPVDTLIDTPHGG